jgi:hypothetical protein
MELSNKDVCQTLTQSVAGDTTSIDQSTSLSRQEEELELEDTPIQQVSLEYCEYVSRLTSISKCKPYLQWLQTRVHLVQLIAAIGTQALSALNLFFC